MNTRTHTFLPGQDLPKCLVLPAQSHGAQVVEIKTGQENLDNCDGLWTRNPEFLLGVRTADCAPICFWDEERFGIVHAGWRGAVNGAIENLLSVFQFELGSSTEHQSSNCDLNIWIGPLLPRFEIQPDDCYAEIQAKFGTQFFTETNNSVFFDFKECLQHILPTAVFDNRSTFDDSNLASWRRDKAFAKGQNVTVIGSKNLF